MSYTLGADGSGEQLLIRPAGGSRVPLNGQATNSVRLVRENGRPAGVQVGRAAAGRFVAASARSGGSARRRTSKLWLFHQANIRILDAAADALAIDRRQVETHIDRYGNTSAGSVPIALDEALRAGRFGRGDLLLMCGFGGGLSWGTAPCVVMSSWSVVRICAVLMTGLTPDNEHRTLDTPPWRKPKNSPRAAR